MIEKYAIEKYADGEYLDGEDAEDVASILFGRRIVAVDESTETLTLDNGDKLIVQPNNGGCICGAGDYELRSLAAFDNAITRVEVDSVELDGEDEWGEVLSVFVYAEGASAKVIEVEGDEGNGYYGRGFQIKVIRGENI